MRRHRIQHQSQTASAVAMALEAERRALLNACAGCCSKQAPCRYHKGYMEGVRAAMAEYVRRAGETD